MNRKSVVLTGLVAALIAYPAYLLWYKTAGGKPGEEARYFASQHASQLDLKGRCADANIAAGFYGRAGMKTKYDEWIAKLRVDCPGSYPVNPYRPDADNLGSLGSEMHHPAGAGMHKTVLSTYRIKETNSENRGGIAQIWRKKRGKITGCCLHR